MVTNNFTDMKNRIVHIGLLFVLVGMISVSFTACDDKIDPLIEELEFDRALAPLELRAFIRNQVAIELNWDVREDVDHYTVEFSQDSLEFSSIIRTVTVMLDELPLLESFESETRYSARVKAISADGKADSKWTTITIMTALENIFLPIQDGDIEALSATLRWPANSDVTHFIIVPGDVQRPITAQEKADGTATIEGLTGNTEHTIQMFNNTKQRGAVTFTTLIDVGDATLIYPEDDLNATIANAAADDVIVLFPGEYVTTGSIAINKSITLRGLYPYDKPLLNVNFVMEAGANDVSLIDLELVGTPDFATVITMAIAGSYNSLTISGCNIHDFGRQLIYGNTSGMVLSNFIVDNCIVTNFISGGGDFIDFRGGDVHNVEVTNSTFVDAPNGRDFIRMDNAGTTNGTGVTATVLIDHCTLVGVSNTADRIVYVRFANNDITVTNNLFANTDAIYSNQTSTDDAITFSNNNYFNAASLFDPTKTRFDGSGSLTQLDPGFVNAAEGDFTVTNQTLKDNEVGDPRWRQ